MVSHTGGLKTVVSDTDRCQSGGGTPAGRTFPANRGRQTLRCNRPGYFVTEACHYSSPVSCCGKPDTGSHCCDDDDDDDVLLVLVVFLTRLSNPNTSSVTL